MDLMSKGFPLGTFGGYHCRHHLSIYTSVKGLDTCARAHNPGFYGRRYTYAGNKKIMFLDITIICFPFKTAVRIKENIIDILNFYSPMYINQTRITDIAPIKYFSKTNCITFNFKCHLL